MAKLTHLDRSGRARMVDVGAKAVSARRAVAEARVRTRPEVIRLIAEGGVPKGDVLAVARLAGIQAAKRTHELIPLCHPLLLDQVSVELALEQAGVLVRAEVRCTGRTGVEMEALVAASLAARKAPARVTPEEYLAALDSALGGDGAEMTALARRAAESAVSGESPSDFVAKTLKSSRGVSGYMYHTMPAVLQVWFNWQHDYESALTEMVRCGGHTDTTAAILGGIIGAGSGPEGIPERWRERLLDWPWNFRYFADLAAAAASGGKAPWRPFFLLPLRNLFFAAVVLFHGFRRLLPPF